MKLLFLEDDGRLGEVVLRGLRGEGHVVDGATTLADARWLISEYRYDVLILDVMLPDGDAYSLCSELRARGCRTPVLLLTARDSVPDRVRGLDVGADDYLVKPFAFEELLARLRALARRGEVPRPLQLEVGTLRIDVARHEAWVAGRLLSLTSREFSLLELFARHPGEALSRGHILEDGWDFAFDGTPRIVDVYVGQLRRHLGTSPGTPRLQTIRGVGYALRTPTPRQRHRHGRTIGSNAG
jgi:two-component system, OmpR family, response regulator